MKQLSRILGLRHPADLRSLAFLTAQSVLMACLWLGYFRDFFVWYAVAWLAVIATNVKHNHMHHRTFRHPLPNLVLDHWLGLLTGTTATSIITEHNLRHHSHPNDDDDFVRAGLVGFRSQALNVLCFFPRALWELYVCKPLDLGIWWRMNRKLFWRGLAEQITLWGTFGILLLLNWRATLLYVALPWLHGQWWLITFNFFLHQDMAGEDEWRNSRNITGRYFNWLFLNIGYHTAHHLRPALHWSELPAFHTREIARRIEGHLVSPSLWSFYADWYFRRKSTAATLRP